MNPQQQYQPPTGDAYDFILNPQKTPKQKKVGLGVGSNFGLTIGIIIGGAVLFMIIVAVVLSMLGGGTNTTNMVSVAQSQNELIRVADQGAKSGVRQTTKNLAVTIQYGITTQQQQALAYLNRAGTSVGTKELTLKQNATTDQRLASAKTTSTFDAEFAKVMQEELTAYANTVRQLYNTSSSQTEKELLGVYYEQAQLLISQIPYTQESITAEP